MTKLPIHRSALLLLVVASVLFVELGSARLWDRDEPRNARASHEMLGRNDWVVPTFNGELRDHKPVLLYWGQMSSYLAFGESELTARLPSAIAAILAAFSIAVLASRLSGKAKGISQEGYWAAGALATCLLFVMAGRAATPDALLIAFSTIGICAIVLSAVVPAHPYSSGSIGSARWGPAMFGYAMLGVAALAKGPVGIILPAAVVHLWWLISDSARRVTSEPSDRTEGLFGLVKGLVQYVVRTFSPFQLFRSVWHLKLIPGLLVAVAVAAPWYYQVGVQTNGEFLRGFFLEHNVGRAVGAMEGHNGSFLFYPFAFLVGTFPWSLWLIPILAWCRKAYREELLPRQVVILGAAWVSVYIVAFSIAQTKLPSYITPCYAGAALVIGSYLRQFENGWSLPAKKVRVAAYAITIATGLMITVVILVLSSQQQMPLLLRASACGVVVVLIGVLGLVWEARNQVYRVPTTWLVGAACFHVILFGFGAKSVDRYRDDLKLLASVQQSQPSEHWITIGGMEPSWVHYLGCEIAEVRQAPSTELAWKEVEDYLRANPTAKLVVVGDEAKQRFDANGLPTIPTGNMKKVGEANRFMRSGDLAIYQLTGAVPPMVAAPFEDVASSASDVGKPLRLPSMPTLRTADRVGEPNAVTIESASNAEPVPSVTVEIMPLSTPTQGQTSGHPNPLRQKVRSDDSIR